MNDALYIAATGMKAQTSQLDTIANNVANASTPGFKRSSLRFGDLVSTGAAAQQSGDVSTASAGVKIGSIQRSFTAGELRRVDDTMSIAIQGDGFIELQLPDGSPAFTRSARLQINADRLLTSSDGLVLRQHIHVPTDVRSVSIAEDGQVTGRDDAGRTTTLGRLDVAVFASPSALTSVGEGLWRPSAGSGDAVLAPPGEAGAGRLKQGFQEASNVQLVEEMVQLMVAQRAYEMNVKVMQAADEIAGMTNNLRK
ncbi:flagellar hook-basal body protein [Roseateles sp. NT4]|uniref:flagellar hook-basal body protein n=1 Tax=Roseateles sp. NT4 TaxID=3453715 RepID=UPI003EEEB21E